MTIAVFVGVVAVSGCGVLIEPSAQSASLAPDPCPQGDWIAVGDADGALGLDQLSVNRHMTVCAAVGVTVEVDAWRRGWALGNARYCTPRVARVLGETNRALNPVCPEEAMPALLQAHADGRLVYDEIERRRQREAEQARRERERARERARRERARASREIDAEIARRRSDIREIEHQIRLSRAAEPPTLNDAQERELRRRISELRREISDLRFRRMRF